MADNFLSFSKDAAKTLGLSEAILLETIKKLIGSNRDDLLELSLLLTEITFWNEEEVKSLLASLELKGLLIFNTDTKTVILVSSNKKHDSASKNHNVFGERTESLMGKNWEPDITLIDQASEYGISKSFVFSQLDEFILLHKEKSDSSHSWGIKFLRFVIKKWRSQEISDYKDSKKKPIDQTWFPDQEATEILTKAGIDEEFTKNEIPEFILYWSEKGEVSDTWNSKFIAQVRRQWAKTQHLINNSEVPEPISSDWKPSEDFYEVLALTRINKNFADSVLAEFILYWKETGQAHNSWNSKFIQHVKFQWQRQKGYNSPKVLDDIERRVESSWAIKTEEEALGRKPLSKKEVQTKLEVLKKKHQI
tara:strand:+ start:862 stop:1953 length:1092 start_codon:yes stop_codon:yes gene_type:complete